MSCEQSWAVARLVAQHLAVQQLVLDVLTDQVMEW